MIANTIQLALAPVFVLVAIGNILNILSTRLGRIVDRSRILKDRHSVTAGDEHDAIVREIRLTDRRIHLVTRAILLLVLSGLSTGVTVVLLFVEDFAGLDLKPFVAASFVIALALLMAALVLFLRETREAAAALRIPAEFLETHREL